MNDKKGAFWVAPIDPDGGLHRQTFDTLDEAVAFYKHSNDHGFPCRADERVLNAIMDPGTQVSDENLKDRAKGD